MSIGQKIRMEAKKQHLNFKQLAIKADISYNSLYSIIKRDSQGVQAMSLYKIAKALEVPMESLVDEGAVTGVIKEQLKPEKKKKKAKEKKKSKKFSH